MYSVEYKWTKKPISETTTSIIAVILSTKYPKLIEKFPVVNHSNELYMDHLLYVFSTKSYGSALRIKNIEFISIKPIRNIPKFEEWFFNLLPKNIKIINDKRGKNKKIIFG